MFPSNSHGQGHRGFVLYPFSPSGVARPEIAEPEVPPDGWLSMREVGMREICIGYCQPGRVDLTFGLLDIVYAAP